MVLQQHQCYDDEAGMNLRRQIIKELDWLVKQWIRSEVNTFSLVHGTCYTNL